MTRPVTPAEAREMLDGATMGPWTAYQPAEFPGDYRIATHAAGANAGGMYYVGRLTRSHPNEDAPTLADASLCAAAPALAETVATEPERIAAAVAAEADRIYRAATAGLDDYLASDAKLLDALGRGEVIDEYHPLILARMRRLDYLRDLLAPVTP